MEILTTRLPKNRHSKTRKMKITLLIKVFIIHFLFYLVDSNNIYGNLFFNKNL